MLTRRRAIAVGTSFALAGCGGDGGPGSPEEDGPGETDAPSAVTATDGGSLSLSSRALEAGGSIPPRFTADGANVSPPLVLDGVPVAAESIALVVDDPDAPNGPFVHWLLWNLPPSTTTVPEDVPRTRRVEDLEAVQGTNDAGEIGYFGPAPPAEDDPHRYRFTASALDTLLEVDPGADRGDLATAIDGHVVETSQFVATYGR
jgi:Raf kinase inhibitor-like YbhB/YbcL family protein